MSLRAVIVDDEFPAREILKAYIEQTDGVTCVASHKNPSELMAWLMEHEADLVFLDVQMPGMTGLEFLRAVRRRPAVVLTTAYAEHALEGYELDLADYLVKPFSLERFQQAVAKVAAQRKGDSAPSPLLQVRADRKTYRLRPEDILCIQGMKEYVAYHTSQGRLMALESLKKLADTLPPQFVRVHKSWIVNRDHVRSVGGNELELPGHVVPLGDSYREEAMRHIL